LDKPDRISQDYQSDPIPVLPICQEEPL
jgi:hypothetical protein